MDYTVGIVVDSHYLAHLRWTSKTWRRFRAEMFNRPWVVAHDFAMSNAELDELASICPRGAKYKSWPPPAVSYETQREKMLSSWLFCIPQMVETPHWMKIDADAFAEREEEKWEFENWLVGGEVACAPAWSYTAPAEYITILQEWGDRHPVIGNHKRLPLEVVPGHKVCKGKRFCSWVSLYDTAWSREVAGYCEELKAPVPSEDSTKWYVAERTGKRWTHYPAKQMGFSNIRNKHRIEARVREILQITD